MSEQLSAETRTFLQKSYPVIKKHNPSVPVLIREAFGVPARVYARYGIACCDYADRRFRHGAQDITGRIIREGMRRSSREVDQARTDQMNCKIDVN
jgi:hypothetical protein